MGISYTNNEVILDQFSFDANAIPIIYFTGHKNSFYRRTKEKIYKYLVDGGTILGNACCGNTVFTESFRKEFENILPQRSFQIISSSHPIYSLHFFKVEKINYIRSGQTKSSETPRLEGVNLGCAD